LKATKKAVRDMKKAEALLQKGIGTLEVTVVSAERLMAADRGGTSDPFIELWVGGKKHKTSTQKKTLNPRWDEPFVLEVPPGTISLDVLVFDSDMVGSAFLGQAFVTLDNLGEAKDILKSYPLLPRSFKDKNPISGSVKLLCNYLTKAAPALSLPKVDKAALETRCAKLGIGSCTIGVYGCVNLMGSDPNMPPNVYVEIKVGEARGMTDVQQVKS
jgi:Ca2+-dependent lipid-binding protein